MIHTSACGGHNYFRLDESVSDFEVVRTTVITILRLNGQNSAQSYGVGCIRSLQLLAVQHVPGDSSRGVFIEIPHQMQLLLKCFFCLVFPCAVCVTVLVR